MSKVTKDNFSADILIPVRLIPVRRHVCPFSIRVQLLRHFDAHGRSDVATVRVSVRTIVIQDRRSSAAAAERIPARAAIDVIITCTSNEDIIVTLAPQVVVALVTKQIVIP